MIEERIVGNGIRRDGRRLRNAGYDVLGAETAPWAFGERDKPHVQRLFIFSEPALRFERVRIREDFVVPVHEDVADRNDSLFEYAVNKWHLGQNRRRHTPPGMYSPESWAPSAGTIRGMG